MKRFWGKTALTVLGGLLIASCGSESTITTNSIEVAPATASIGITTAQQFSATAILSDGTKKDVTAEATWATSDEALATVNTDGSATGVSAGEAVISATYDGKTGSATLTVTGATIASLAVTPATPSIAAGTTQQFTATATMSDSSTQDVTDQVTWASSDAAVATLGSDGLATGRAEGSTTISATLNEVTGNTTLTVSAATLQTIGVTPTDPSIAAGTGQQFTATGTFSDNSTQDITTQVTWSSSDTAVADISNDAGSEGVGAGLSAGTATITASLSNVTGTTTLTVTEATLASIAVTPATPSTAIGTTLQFTATGTFTDNTTQDLTTQVIWASGDETVATISNDAANSGLASSAGVGTTNITATLDTVSGSTELTVTAATLESIDITPAAASIANGTTQQFMATGTYTDSTTQDLTASVSWSSSDTDAATISNADGSEGLASGASQGQTTITATQGGISGTATLNVTAATLVSIAVTPANDSVARGLDQQFTATGTYTDSTTQNLTDSVTWSSSADGVVSISNADGSRGLGTTGTTGTATVTATLDGISGSTSFEVTAATLVSIGVTPTTTTLADGITQQYTATGTYTDNSTLNITTQVTWSSTAPTVASIDPTTGLATAESPGNATITATSGSTSGTASITVTAATVARVDVTPDTPSIAPQTTIQFSATAVFTDGTNQNVTTSATWVSSETGFATIDIVTGFATTLAAGTSTISATFSGVTGNTDLTVTAATLSSIAITPSNLDLPRGDTQNLRATGTFSDGTTQDLTNLVTWSSNNETVATVSNASGSNGLLTANDTGGTTIEATYLGTTGSALVGVTPAVLVSIAVDPPNADAARGTTQQYTATGTYSDSTTRDLTNTVAWGSSNTNFATISNAVASEGLASALNVGTTTITAGSGAITGSTLLTVTAAELVTIEVTPTEPSIANGTSQQFTATGTYTDNTTQNITTQVTWGSDDTDVATVSNADGSEGLATSQGEGVALITATSGTVSGSSDLSVTAAVVTSVSVSPSNRVAADGTRVQYTATATFSDNSTQDVTTAAAWSTDDADVATIETAGEAPGLATAVDPGSASITATFNGETGSTTLTVTPAALTAIQVTPADESIARGTTQQYTATGTFTDNSTQDITTQVTWASSNTTVASISNAVGTDGLASADSTGDTTISATLSDVMGDTNLQVTAAELVTIEVTPTNPTLPDGLTQQFIATGTYTDNTTQDITAQVTWASNNTEIATVSNADTTWGLGTAVDPGVATISASFTYTPIAGGDDVTIVGTSDFTVTDAQLVSIEITPDGTSIAKGFARRLTATGTYTDSSTQDLTTDVSWSSSDNSIAFVSNLQGSQGAVTALEVGSVTITASLDGIQDTTAFTVTPATLVSLSLAPLAPVAARDTTVYFTVTGTFSDSSTQDLTSQVSWTSSDISIATIFSQAGPASGIATAVSSGQTTITAAQGGITATTVMTVTPATLVSITVEPSPLILDYFGNPSGFMVATGNFSDNSSQNISEIVTWSSDNGAIAAVSNAQGSWGLVTAVNLFGGSTMINAELGGVSGSASVIVGFDP